MSLSTGTRLGPYEILTPLGAGGMGEVYKARDTRLDRTVAIKVLPEHLSQKPELRQRFEREARSISSLNHPHICTLFDVGHQDGIDYLVMEYVEGPTLAERIGHSPMPLDESLGLAKQIAEGLEYAHEKGIIHRDLKPANVKITTDGCAKLLDFGLAKALEEPKPQGHLITSPTLTLEATGMGTILGTAAYMSPEQASGKPVDRRSDIWSFGVVLWEMLTGRRLFDGETISHTLADVLRGEIDFTTVPSSTPITIRELLRRCLDRSLKSRLQAIGEARVAIEKHLADPKSASLVTGTPTSNSRRRAILPWVVAGALTVVSVALSSWLRGPVEERVVKFTIPAPENVRLSSFVLSPDGRRLAFIGSQKGQSSIWVRSVDDLSAKPLPGTIGTANAGVPFWSPDSRFIGFFADRKLKTIEVSGGPPQALADAPNGRGGTWNRDGVILYTPTQLDGLYRVPAEGGAATRLTTPDHSLLEDSHRWPWFLPDGHHYVYLARSSPLGNSAIYLGELDSPRRIRLVGAESSVAYIAPHKSVLFGDQPGHLLFVRDDRLMAQPFEWRKAQFRGDPFPVADHVTVEGISQWGAFSISDDGALAYGSLGGLARSRLAWRNRAGAKIETVGEAGVYISLSLAPDEKRVAVSENDPQRTSDTWLVDLARGVSTRLTFSNKGGFASSPIWSPDGASLIVGSRSGTYTALLQKAANGAGEAQLVLDLKNQQAAPTDWSPDGRYLLYHQVAQGNTNLWLLPLSRESSGDDRSPIPFHVTDHREFGGKFSPNGRWIAYISDQSGQDQVYVRPSSAIDQKISIPERAGQYQLSSSGGTQPRWRHDGRELFYIAPDGVLMAVEVKPDGASFESGSPRALFQARETALFDYAVAADGKRFLILSPAEELAPSTPITVVLNWQAGLKK